MSQNFKCVTDFIYHQLAKVMHLIDNS